MTTYTDRQKACSEQWLFVAMDDDRYAHLTYCADGAAVKAAVTNAMLHDADDLLPEHAEEIKGVTENLIENGSHHFEGDAPLYLFRVGSVESTSPITGFSEPDGGAAFRLGDADALAAELWKAADKCGFDQFREVVRNALEAPIPEHSAIYIAKRLTGSDASASFVQAHINQAVSEAMDAAPSQPAAPAEPCNCGVLCRDTGEVIERFMLDANIDGIDQLREFVLATDYDKRVHDLETLCDPAGLVAENALLRDQTKMLDAMIGRLKSELAVMSMAEPLAYMVRHVDFRDNEKLWRSVEPKFIDKYRADANYDIRPMCAAPSQPAAPAFTKAPPPGSNLLPALSADDFDVPSTAVQRATLTDEQIIALADQCAFDTNRRILQFARALLAAAPAEPMFTQADMERYGKAYADARDARRAAPSTVAQGATLTDERRPVGEIRIGSDQHPYAVLTTAYDASGTGWTAGTKLYVCAEPSGERQLIAWMTKDGSFTTALNRECMKPATRAFFTIPLYDRASAAPTPVADSGAMTDEAVLSEFVARVVLNISELPDRTSPEDDPEAMLCNSDEIDWSIQGALEHLGFSIVRAAEKPVSVDAVAHGHRTDYLLLANARRIVKREYQRSPNWVVAMELFATGSTSAHQICRDAGIDPDGFKVVRADTTPPTESTESTGEPTL